MPIAMDEIRSDHYLARGPDTFGSGKPFGDPLFLLKAAAAGTPAEIYVYDDIGPSWAGMIDARSVVTALEKIGSGPVTVRVNSRGGDAIEGIAIYNALLRYGKVAGNSVLVGIDAMAASAASLVAMAGDRVEVAANGLLMVHRAWTLGLGNQTDFRKIADILGRIDGSIAKTYSAKTGAAVETLLDLMEAETWMDAEEALAAKFVDGIGDATPAEAPKAKAGWYGGRQEPRKGDGRDRRFDEIAAVDRAVTLRRVRVEIR